MTLCSAGGQAGRPWVAKTGVDAFVGRDVVEHVRLSHGTTLPAEVVVVGIGVMPRTEVAEAAGLEIDNGVVTDEYLQTPCPGGLRGR